LISKNTIDKVFEIARVEEVIGEFLSLKKSGSNFKGLSPFSQERTPSFMVSPVKQIWKDFSSGKGGNVVAFLMEHEHFTYPEAIKYLANKYNIEIEETQINDKDRENRDHIESLYLQNNFAQKHFSKNIWETNEGKSIGLSYFKERGFSEEIIRLFGLGYALEKKDDLFNTAKKEGYSDQFLDETGLVIYSDRGAIDRFRGRVIFPIKSMAGRIQGFGGRILSSNAKKAKYLNSPESKIYNKSKILYGIYEAKKEIAKEDVCYLVEGYTDVIQMYQKGIKNVVSSSGTALTIEQIQLIRRLTSNIIVLFDGDAAGLRAALRGIDIILSEGLNVKICSFPEGDDPDSFALNNNFNDIKNYIVEKAKDFIEFKTDILIKEGSNDPIKKAETVRDIVQSIEKIPDPIKQEIYLRQCANQMQISEEVVFNSFAQEKNKVISKRKLKLNQDYTPQKKIKKQNPDNPLLNIEKQIISILILYGNDEAFFDETLIFSDAKGNLKEQSKTVQTRVFEKIFLDLQQDEIEMIQPEFQLLYNQLIDLFQREGKIETDKIVIQEQNPKIGKLLTDILLDSEKHQLHDWNKKNIFVKDRKSVVGQLVSETILTFRKYLVDQKIQKILEVAQKKQKDYNSVVFLEEVIQYQNLKKVLSKKLNRVL
tara:strand:- start:146 stop:2101 length:1956 start_codon:yes stop_codon:yes gene_type:complete